MFWKVVPYDPRIESDSNMDKSNFIRFPDHQELLHFRTEWMMERRARPSVPQPQMTPMPDRERTADGKAKLFSIYLRPWVLHPDDVKPSVPLLKDLNIVPRELEGANTGRRRLRQKTTDSAGAFTVVHRDMAAAWSWYVRGHIVSEHAKKIIVQFMAACCGKSVVGARRRLALSNIIDEF